MAGDRLQFQLPLASPLPAPPAATIYAVRAVKGNETSAYSNRVTLVAREPMAPPKNLQVDAAADGIRLSWESEAGARPPPWDSTSSGATPRARSTARRSPGCRAASAAFTDQAAAFGNRYIYTVRAIANANPLVLERPGRRTRGGVRGPLSRRRCRPTSSPSANAAPCACAGMPVPVADLKGYLIYRKDPGRDFAKLTPEPIAANDFTDRGLSSGLTFEYQIVSVDKSGNESPRSAPVSTVTR